MASRRRLAPVPVEHISRSILVLRGQRVILDSDLAVIYGVTTGRLNEAVKHNVERFPEDFMFRLSAAEHAVLLSQFGDGSRYFVDRMTVADDCRPKSQQRCCP